MDEIVLRAMQKWPNVPQVFGWLRLDRRGRWLVKTARGDFDRVANPALVEFIDRNYECDEQGRWFFQNGPQRVFVRLDYTPWVYRLNEASDGLVTHTGRDAGRICELLVDEAGGLLAAGDPGIGVVDDRDLPALADLLCGDEPLLDRVQVLIESGVPAAEIQVLGQRAMLGAVRSDQVAARFGFNPRPAPPEGRPDC
jgi:hypothetical protein